MSSDEIAQYCVSNLEFALQGVALCTEPAELAAHVSTSILYYQAVGICELIYDAETDAFYDHLTRSGLLQLQFLQRVKNGLTVPSKFTKASELRGFCAAHAAGDWDLAKRIADVSSTQATSHSEYPEDFYMAQFMFACTRHATDQELDGIATAVEQALGNIVEVRAQLARAICNKDESAVHQSFEALLVQREGYLNQCKTQAVGQDPVFVPMSSIYIEGLAWLRILEVRGFKMKPDYPYCPNLARLPRAEAFQGPGVPAFSI